MGIPSSGEESAPGRGVLIIEDNADGRETLRCLLSLTGFAVEVAADGNEGVKKGLALRPCAALIDIGLPSLDGFEVARRLRAELGSSILLIAHTARGLPEGRAPPPAPFDAWLQKPANLVELLALLNRAEGAGPAG